MPVPGQIPAPDMRVYNPGKWGVGFAFSCYGSTFPRALTWSLASTGLTVGMYFVPGHAELKLLAEGTSVGQVWAVFNWSVGFLVAFRTQQAYSRWWEGGSLLQQARGEWFNAYSGLLSFCTSRAEKRDQVHHFRIILARLISLLYCAALSQIAQGMEFIDFEVLDLEGIDPRCLLFLRSRNDKVEIVLAWIQRLVIENTENGVLTVPPPILSRTFQELSRGVVNFNNVRRISEFLFPFPFAQAVTVLLLVHWAATPFVMSMICMHWGVASVASFTTVFFLWTINYASSEVEQPFGQDPNDLPMRDMQAYLNEALLTLLEEEARHPPAFRLNTSVINLVEFSKEVAHIRSRTADMLLKYKRKSSQKSAGSRTSGRPQGEPTKTFVVPREGLYGLKYSEECSSARSYGSEATPRGSVHMYEADEYVVKSRRLRKIAGEVQKNGTRPHSSTSVSTSEMVPQERTSPRRNVLSTSPGHAGESAQDDEAVPRHRFDVDIAEHVRDLKRTLPSNRDQASPSRSPPPGSTPLVSDKDFAKPSGILAPVCGEAVSSSGGDMYCQPAQLRHAGRSLAARSNSRGRWLQCSLDCGVPRIGENGSAESAPIIASLQRVPAIVHDDKGPCYPVAPPTSC